MSNTNCRHCGYEHVATFCGRCGRPTLAPGTLVGRGEDGAWKPVGTECDLPTVRQLAVVTGEGLSTRGTMWVRPGGTVTYVP